MKKIIKLTENDVRRIVKNSVKRILKEEAGFNGMKSHDSINNGQWQECMRIMQNMIQQFGAQNVLVELGNCMGYDEWCQYVQEVERRLMRNKQG